MKMAEDNTAIMSKLCFEAWRDLVSVLQREHALEAAEKEAERLRQMHDPRFKRLVANLLSGPTRVFVCWKDFTKQSIHNELIKAHLLKAQERYAAQQLASMLQSVTAAWSSEARRAASERAEISRAEQRRTSQSHLLGKYMMNLGGAVQDVQLGSVFKAWWHLCLQESRLRLQAVLSEEKQKAEERHHLLPSELFVRCSLVSLSFEHAFGLFFLLAAKKDVHCLLGLLA